MLAFRLVVQALSPQYLGHDLKSYADEPSVNRLLDRQLRQPTRDNEEEDSASVVSISSEEHGREDDDGRNFGRDSRQDTLGLEEITSQ